MSNKKANTELRYQTRMIAIKALINLSADEITTEGSKFICADYFKLHKVNPEASHTIENISYINNVGHNRFFLWEYEGNSVARIYKPNQKYNFIMPIYIYEN